MVRLVQCFGAAALALALAASSAANAQAVTGNARSPKPAKQTAAGRQITVHRATPSYLTLGPNADVGYGNNYVTDTFSQPTPIEGTFAGSRGREALGDTRFNGAGIPLFRF
jgi:hypothetical protein